MNQIKYCGLVVKYCNETGIPFNIVYCSLHKLVVINTVVG